MSFFFDIENQADLNLLHSSVRDNDELANIVDQVEWEMIEYFRQRPDMPLYFRSGLENLSSLNRIRVRLIGYNEDDPEDSSDELKEAFRRAIAYVVSDVIRNYNNVVNATSIRQGQRSVTYNGKVPDVKDWPSGWKRFFKNYDDREAVYSI